MAGKDYSNLGKSVSVKNSFVCLSSTEDILALAIEATGAGIKPSKDSWPGACSDGEKPVCCTAGLSCFAGPPAFYHWQLNACSSCSANCASRTFDGGTNQCGLRSEPGAK